jgi:hypothetical protein
MNALKEQKKDEYIQNVYGFDCQKLCSLDCIPTFRQLWLLYEVIKLSEFQGMETFTSRGKKFVWINYGMLFSSMQWQELSPSTMTREVTSLVSMGLVDIYEENKTGKKKVFFHATNKAKALRCY